MNPNPRATFKIRPATAEDTAAIMNVMRGVYTEYGFIFKAEEEVPDLLEFDKNYDQHSGAFFVGEIDGKVLGTVGIKFGEPATMEIFRLYLDSCCRGLGLGRRLLEEAIQWGREHGATEIFLWSDTRFEAAHRLYTRAGFVQGPLRHTEDINESVEYKFAVWFKKD